MVTLKPPPATNTDPHLRMGFTLVELLVVIAIIGILVALLLPAVNAAREAARKTQCASRLRNISLAILQFESAQRQFPSGAKYTAEPTTNGVSWTVAVLPYLEEAALSDDVRQRMNQVGAENYDAYELGNANAATIVPFVCPSDDMVVDNARQYQTGETMPGTSFAAIMGSAASRGDLRYVVGTDDANGLCGTMSTDGIMFPSSRTRMRNVTDGTSKTLLIAERWYQLRSWSVGAYYRPEFAVDSGAPRRPIPSCVSACKNINSHLRLNANLDAVGYYVNHRENDRPNMPPGASRTIRFNDLPFGSLHPGGTHVANAGGSVRFLSDDIDGIVLTATASRNGRETASIPD